MNKPKLESPSLRKFMPPPASGILEESNGEFSCNADKMASNSEPNLQVYAGLDDLNKSDWQLLVAEFTYRLEHTRTFPPTTNERTAMQRNFSDVRGKEGFYKACVLQFGAGDQTRKLDFAVQWRENRMKNVTVLDLADSEGSSSSGDDFV